MGEYIARNTMQFHRLLNMANDQGKIDEMSYRRLYGESCTTREWEPVFDYFTGLNQALVKILQEPVRQELMRRIEKAGLYFGECDKNSPIYPAAVLKFETMMKEMDEIGWE